ncbi:MAG: 50S ribosomal protein L29 [Candidatus Paceibacterota bacterium]|jgi:ribosomal protein L29
MSNEFKNKTDAELVAMLLEKREAVRAFRFGIAGSKNRNMREGRNLKREIAKIMTEQNQRKNSK